MLFVVLCRKWFWNQRYFNYLIQIIHLLPLHNTARVRPPPALQEPATPRRIHPLWTAHCLHTRSPIGSKSYAGRCARVADVERNYQGANQLRSATSSLAVKIADSAGACNPIRLQARTPSKRGTGGGTRWTWTHPAGSASARSLVHYPQKTGENLN